jgi:FlaG/FlaF family flagellin (archaellin)
MKIPRARRRKNGAISEIISVVLMIMIVITVAALILAFATTGLGSFASGFSSLLSGEGNSLSQQLSIEQIAYQYSSGLGPYVPILISNSQNSATSSPFQQMITIDPALYTSLEASDLGNIRFYSSISGGVFSGALDSWLESFTGSTTANSATNAIFWLKLPSGIPALGSTTVYMAFLGVGTEFDGAVAGEAPNLSPSYAGYDNGANVFLAYFNGNTALSSFSEYSGYTLTQATGIAYTSGTINALNLKGYNSANPAMAFNVALPNEALLVESNAQDPNSVSPGTDTGHSGLVNNPTAGSVTNGIGVQSGYSRSYFNLDYINGGAFSADHSGQGASVSSWTYSSLSYSGPSSTSFYGYNAPQLYSTTGGYSGTANVNPISGASNLYLGVLADTSSTYTVNIYFNWMRARASPPGGVMPSVTINQLVSGQSAGGNLYLRNVGSTIVTISAVYVQNVTANSFVEGYQLNPTVTIQPGSLSVVNVPFNPLHGETYSFTVTTTLGYSTASDAPA